MGRPPLDPSDLRTERIAIRLHPDLYGEVSKGARAAGTNKSLYIERIVINYINSELAQTGERPLDNIGKYYDDSELERMHAARAARTGFDHLRDPLAYRLPRPPGPTTDVARDERRSPVTAATSSSRPSSGFGSCSTPCRTGGASFWSRSR